MVARIGFGEKFWGHYDRFLRFVAKNDIDIISIDIDVICCFNGRHNC